MDNTVNRLPSVVKCPIGLRVPLPAPCTELEQDLSLALRMRKSGRHFNGENITLQNVSNLLFHAIGHQGFAYAGSFGIVQKRNYPSPGARHSLEFYLIVEQSSGLDGGVYHCSYDCQSLVQLRRFQVGDRRSQLFPNQDWAEAAPGLIFISTKRDRIAVKYGGSENRFGLIEAGHAAQNLSLVATALGMTSCAIGGWKINEVRELIGADGIDEDVIYALAIG